VKAATRGIPGNPGAAFALLSALGFATLGLWGKFAQQLGLSTESFLTFRFALAAIALVAVAPRASSGRERLRQVAFGLVYIVQTMLYFTALKTVSAGVTSLLLYLAPAFVVLYEWLLGVKPKAMQLIGLGLEGLGLLVIVGLPGAKDGDALGFLLATLSGACYAGFLVASGRLFPNADSLTLTANAALGSAAGFVILGLSTGTLQIPTQPLEWGVILGAVVFATLLAIPLMFRAIQTLGATGASLLLTLEPVFVAFLALAFLGEALTPNKLIGGGLILAGALLAQQRTRR
jgi:drug/metabolite transporter (DMT)-like permease